MSKSDQAEIVKAIRIRAFILIGCLLSDDARKRLFHVQPGALSTSGLIGKIMGYYREVRG